MGLGLLDDRSRTSHVLVGRVGARAHKTNQNVPFFFLFESANLEMGVARGTIDVGLSQNGGFRHFQYYRIDSIDMGLELTLIFGCHPTYLFDFQLNAIVFTTTVTHSCQSIGNPLRASPLILTHYAGKIKKGSGQDRHMDAQKGIL